MPGPSPAWAGFSFTYPKLHSTAASTLNPSQQHLPSPFVVAILGGSRNIGAEIAKAFAAAGASGIVITGTKEDALNKTKAEIEAIGSFRGLKVTVVQADIGDMATAGIVAASVENTYGRLDVLVNNAAIVSTDATAFERPHNIKIENIEKTIRINYVGKFNATREILPLLLKTKDGARTIINITSAMSHFGALGAIGYNISELAVNRLTEALAEAYLDEGILSYCVHPGIVATMPPPMGMESPDARPMAKDDVALCGAFLLWLVKEKREWLSGRYLSANWDVEELEAKREAIVSGDRLKMRMVV
jgi:NAD(P)-dependent dehydrogenase (short-subunit alcohol dehydrogenase family)